MQELIRFGSGQAFSIANGPLWSDNQGDIFSTQQKKKQVINEIPKFQQQA